MANQVILQCSVMRGINNTSLCVGTLEALLHRVFQAIFKVKAPFGIRSQTPLRWLAAVRMCPSKTDRVLWPLPLIYVSLPENLIIASIYEIVLSRTFFPFKIAASHLG